MPFSMHSSCEKWALLSAYEQSKDYIKFNTIIFLFNYFVINNFEPSVIQNMKNGKKFLLSSRGNRYMT